MASTKDYKNFIMDQLSELDNVTCKPMMGEYILYYNGVIFGGIYDDRLLVKRVEGNKDYEMQEVIPYPNAKPMYYVEDVDSPDNLKDIVLDTYRDFHVGLAYKAYEYMGAHREGRNGTKGVTFKQG